MQLLFLVIKRIELVDEIMRSLAQAGIRGGTVIDSVGMAKSISTMDNLPLIGVLRSILSGEDAAQKGKTIFVAVADDQVDVARNTGVSATAISRYLNESSDLRADALIKVLNYLGADIDSLMKKEISRVLGTADNITIGEDISYLLEQSSPITRKTNAIEFKYVSSG